VPNIFDGLVLKDSGQVAQPRADASDLTARARRGDAAAFDALYEMHKDRIFTLCLNMSGNHEEAGDLLQETFTRAWRGVRKFRGHSSFGTWLYKIAINVCRATANKKTPFLPDIADVGKDQPLIDCVRVTLSQLRPDYRLVLTLRYSQKLSYAEIAEQLDWSLAKVKVTIHRAKQAFRDEYISENGNIV